VPRVDWPEWWAWEIEVTPHVERRMEDRGFSELDLREMLHRASAYRHDEIEGRWVIETTHDRHPWAVVVEPDPDAELLVVVTAFKAEV
jgi:hypothetical protein